MTKASGGKFEKFDFLQIEHFKNHSYSKFYADFENEDRF